MAHPVTSFITIYGTAAALAPEMNRIQDALVRILSTPGPDTISQENLLTAIYGRSGAVPLLADKECWPRWVKPEFRSRDFLTFISPNHATDEIQDHLTSHLSALDPRVIILMEWENWPLECGSRIAFMHASRLVSIRKDSRQDQQIFQEVYCARSGEAAEDEASIAYMWDEIGHCTDYVKAMARRGFPIIRKSSFSNTLF